MEIFVQQFLLWEIENKMDDDLKATILIHDEIQYVTATYQFLHGIITGSASEVLLTLYSSNTFEVTLQEYNL